MGTRRSTQDARHSTGKVLVLAALVASLVGLVIASSPRAAATGILSNNLVPAVAVAPDTSAVELGIRFRTGQSGTITALQFYRSPEQKLAYTGTLWSANGNRLATTRFAKSSVAGWQTAKLNKPVAVPEGRTLVASYFASNGRYAVTSQDFLRPYEANNFTVPAGGGVYQYGGGFPTQTYHGCNYMVDVVFKPTPTLVATSTPSATATPTPSASGTIATPSNSFTVPRGKPASLNLRRIPWEGGPSYWKKFPNAKNWTDPSFFPIGIWYNGISSDAEVQWDSHHGINFYIGMWEGTDFSLFERNNVYWVGGKLNSTFKASSPNWPGVFMDDEVDGRYSPARGFAELSKIKKEYANSGKFLYANFTQMVIGSDLPLADQQTYVNDFTDAVSVDMYWYTIPFCDWTPYRGNIYASPVPKSTCRTASSYGKTMKSLTIRDAADGRLQPRWQFVENLDGLSGQQHVRYVTPGQLRGAAISSIIGEARGLIWFNQSFTGPCQATSVLRQAQVSGPSWCGYPQVEAMGQVNNFIHKLAPVINSQSYRWTFGNGLDTMLKAYGGNAYIFAMTDGTTGSRTFKLPTNVIRGKSIEVLGENRTLRVSSSGTFSDWFPHEYTYHVYRIPLGAGK